MPGLESGGAGRRPRGAQRGAQTCSDPRRLVRRQGASSSAHHRSVCPDFPLTGSCEATSKRKRPAVGDRSAPLAVTALNLQESSRHVLPGPVRIAGSPLPLLPGFPTTCFAKVFSSGLPGGGPFSPRPISRDRWRTRLALLTQL